MNVMHSRDRDSNGKFTVKQGPKIGTHNGCKRSYLGVKLKRKYLSSDNYSTLMKTAHVRLEESMIPIPMSKQQISMPINTTTDDPCSPSSDMFSPTDPYMQLIGVADQLLSTGSASSDGGTDGGIELEQQNSSMQKYQHFNDVFQQQYQEQQQYQHHHHQQQQQQQHHHHQGHHQQHQYEYGHYSSNFGGASNSSSSSSSSSHMMPAQHSTKNNPHRAYHSHTNHQPSNHIPYYGGVNSQMIHTSRVGQQQQQPYSASSRVTAAVKAMVAQQQQTSKLFRTADKDFQQSGRQQQQQQKEDMYSSPNFDYSQLFLNSTGNSNSSNNNNSNNNNLLTLLLLLLLLLPSLMMLPMSEKVKMEMEMSPGSMTIRTGGTSCTIG